MHPSPSIASAFNRRAAELVHYFLGVALAELLPALRQLPALDKLRLSRILAEDLDTAEDIAPFKPHKMYYVLTPYQTFGAGRALMQAMPQTESI